MPLHVVTQVVQNNNTEYADTIDYTYGGLKCHLTGKGLLGFTKIYQDNRNLSTSFLKTIELDTLTHNPKKVILLQQAGSYWAKTITNYGYVQLHQTLKSFYTYPATVQETDADGKEFNKAYAYDFTKDGALTTEQTTHNDGQTTLLYSSFVLRNGRYLPTIITKHTQYSGQEVFTEKKHLNYNLKGLLTTKTDRYNTDYAVYNNFTYDSFGNILTSRVSSNGCAVSKSYQYDATHRFVTLLTEMSDKRTYYTHDLWGNVVTETDKTRYYAPITTTYTYDGWGRKTSELKPTGQLVKYTRGWSNDGGCFLVTQGSGMPWQKDLFDKLGRIRLSQSISYLDLPTEDSYEYGLQGEITRHTRCEGSGYDALLPMLPVPSITNMVLMATQQKSSLAATQ